MRRLTLDYLKTESGRAWCWPPLRPAAVGVANSRLGGRLLPPAGLAGAAAHRRSQRDPQPRRLGQGRPDAVFFFVLGMELKFEVLRGELSNPRRLALPAAAAAGGLLLPAAIYLALNRNDPSAGRWAARPTARRRWPRSAWPARACPFAARAADERRDRRRPRRRRPDRDPGRQHAARLDADRRGGGAGAAGPAGPLAPRPVHVLRGGLCPGLGLRAEVGAEHRPGRGRLRLHRPDRHAPAWGRTAWCATSWRACTPTSPIAICRCSSSPSSAWPIATCGWRTWARRRRSA